nr:MAG TPA: hypothetical protein [Caudoviricetes sp.]
MKERNITINIDQARELFNSGNKQLREIALQAFDKTELTSDFTDIETFQDACKALKLNYGAMLSIVNTIKQVSRASAAMFKLNIVRKALNLGKDLSLTKDSERSYIYYPYTPFVTTSSTYYVDSLNSDKVEIIGKIKSGGEVYNVLGGFVGASGSAGLGSFTPDDGVGRANAYFGFLGCASKDIAQHFSKYFGMLITIAKYGGLVSDFEIIESKYRN